MNKFGVLAFAGAIACCTSPGAPASAATAREVIAATTLSSVVVAPLYFRVMSGTLSAGEESRFEDAQGIIYQLSGSLEVVVAGTSRTLEAGQGMFIPAGTDARLTAEGSVAARFLHFLLTPAAGLDQPVESAPAMTHEIFRTAAPIPDLKAGPYDLNLTRISFPPRMPANSPHYRSGAAVYDILSGTGANTVGGKIVTRPSGTLVYEPFGLVHQWGNPSHVPLTFLTFNINPHGTAAVLFGAPKAQQ